MTNNKENFDYKTACKTSDGQFGCPDCKGQGKIFFEAWYNLSAETKPCYGCKGTGYYVEYLILKIGCERGTSGQYKHQYEVLKTWLKTYSTCKTCKGRQGATPGGTHCPECDLLGDQPWGG